MEKKKGVCLMGVRKKGKVGEVGGGLCDKKMPRKNTGAKHERGNK